MPGKSLLELKSIWQVNVYCGKEKREKIAIQKKAKMFFCTAFQNVGKGLQSFTVVS